MRVVRDEIWLCVDCLMIAVNGDASGLDYSYAEPEATERLAAIEAGLSKLGPHLVPDFDIETGEGTMCSRRSGCDCCGIPVVHTTVHRFAILGSHGQTEGETGA